MSLPCEVDGGVEEQVGAGLDVGRRAVFGFAVTEPALAADEDHPARADLGQVLGIVAGAGPELAGRDPEGSGGRPDRILNADVKRSRFAGPEPLDPGLDATPGCDIVDQLTQPFD